MSAFELNIRCDSAHELASVLATLSLGGAKPVGAPKPAETNQPEADDTSEDALEAARNGGDGVADPKPAKRTRKSKGEGAPTQNPDGSPIAPTTEPLPQPTPGGTEAPPAESIPPNQPPAGQPAAQADVFGGGAASTGQPAATAGDAAAGNAEAPDLPMLKSAMAELLRVKSATVCMNTLEDATGCKSISTGSPSVIEKAKTDPSVMKIAYDALVAGKAAA